MLLCRSRQGIACPHRSHINHALLLIIMIVVFKPSVSWSQNQFTSLSGTVVDATNGETLPGANIVLLPGQHGAATDQYGRFYIANLAPGRYRLQVSFIGYENHRDSFNLAMTPTRHFRIMLKPEPVVILEITVTGERERLTREVNLRGCLQSQH